MTWLALSILIKAIVPIINTAFAFVHVGTAVLAELILAVSTSLVLIHPKIVLTINTNAKIISTMHAIAILAWSTLIC